MAVWLVVIVGVSIAFRAWLGSRMPAPFIFTDELTYQENARSLAAGAGIQVRTSRSGSSGALYLIVLAGLRPLRLPPTRTRPPGQSMRS